MPPLRPIRYVDRTTGRILEEQVYGARWVQLLYGTRLGRLLSAAVAAPPVSRLYGWLQDRSASARKIGPFVREFGIELAEFLPDEGRPPDAPYATFNGFFTRRLAPGARPVAPPPGVPAPCDARYLAYRSLNTGATVPVKGASLNPRALLGDPAWAERFAGGPALVARLCPVDYHRFHFPDAGEVAASWRIPGAFHSVNPWALAFRRDIFLVNERQVTILDTAHLGTLAYVEVGATCVGKIVQTHSGRRFARGQEKGLFRFGGSTVILLGENNRWVPDADLLEATGEGLETHVKMGQALGTATPPAG